MEKRFDIKDYKDALQKEEYESIYSEIVNCSIELANKIAKIKNIELNTKEDLEDKLYAIQFAFNRECASFRGIIYLMKNLIEWNYEDEVEDEIDIEFGDEELDSIVLNNSMPIPLLYTKEEILKNCMKTYNKILDELDTYYRIENEIKKYNYEKLLKQKKDNLIRIFKDMLEYQKIDYKSNWNLQQFAEKIKQNFSYYSDEISNILLAINSNKIYREDEEEFIPINKIEILMLIDDFCDELIGKK